MKSGHCLIIGCGDIGTRVGLEWLARGGQVTALRRNPQRLPTTFTAVAGDYTSVTGLSALRGLKPDLVVFTPLPMGRDAAGYERGYVEAVDAMSAAGLLASARGGVMVSSTRVYAEQDGGWVDETSAITQTDPAAQAIYRAEQQFLAAVSGGAVLRASGIYGPELGSTAPGMLLARVMRGELTVDAHRFSNRIHRQDLAAAVVHLLTAAAEGEPLSGVFNASDSEPSPIGEVEAWLAQSLGIETTVAASPSSAMPRGNRRVANGRLLETGFALDYPDYRAGYQSVIAQLKDQNAD